jgi:ParB/RepB/Spo0J family partition protein
MGAVLQLKPEPRDDFRVVPVTDIFVNPEDNVRTEYDPKKIDELAGSIATLGQLQNVVVERLEKPMDTGEHYRLISGFRRLLALQQANKSEVLVVIKAPQTDTVRAEINLAENLVREDVSLYDIFKRTTKLLNSGLTAEDIARSAGVNIELIEKIELILRNVTPDLIKILQHDESPKTLLHLQYVAKNIGKDDTAESKKRLQLDWWKTKGKKPGEPSVTRNRPKPEDVFDAAKRIIAARGLRDRNGNFVSLSQAEAEAVASALAWSADAKGRRPPI